MKRKTVFLMSGQGSQYYRMGVDLHAAEPVFRRSMKALDAVVAEAAGFSLLAVLYGENARRTTPFDRTLHTHPALFMVQYSLAQTLLSRGIEPDYLLGTSLGEYVAAALAGIASPEQVLRTLLHKARLAEQHCSPGAMLAVLDDPARYERDPMLHRNSTLAGVNHDQHFVLSGEREALQRVHAHLQAQQVVCLMLPISHGFHSSAMDPCLPALLAVEPQNLAAPRIPLISCLFGDRLAAAPGNDYFWQIGRRPILFREAVAALLRAEPDGVEFIDVGPGATLSGFLKRLVPAGHPHSIRALLSPFAGELDGLHALAPRSDAPRATTVGEPQNMYAFVFPGQGAQKKGMGAALFEKYPEQVASADRILGYSIASLCLDDPHGQLDQTLYTQPALYVVNALSYLDASEQEAVPPAFVAGHSLGEYAALFAAGMVDFETGLRLVHKRATLMSQATAGAMSAVLGLDRATLRALLDANGGQAIDIANLNTPSQIVISGPLDAVSAVKPVLEQAPGCRGVIQLAVSGAFHSRLMLDAQREFERFLAGFELAAPRIPVISNVTARPYEPGEAKRLLATQITHSVNWVDSVRYMWGQGVETFRELGHGRVLTNLVAKIRNETTPLVEAPPSARVEPASRGAAAPAAPLAAVPVVAVAAPLTPAPLAAAQPRAAAPAASGRAGVAQIRATSLGSEAFRADYNLKYAYVGGAMVHGIASVAMVVRMARAGMLAFFGTGGLRPADVERAILEIRDALGPDATFGMNLLNGSREEAVVALLLKHGVRNVEASAYMQISPGLVLYRLRGLQAGPDGRPVARNRIMAKLSRPEVAAGFLKPAPAAIVDKLLQSGAITAQQAAWARELPMADDICVEADSGGHTDSGVAAALLPVIIAQRDEAMAAHGYAKLIRIGSAGGIGTPEAAASAFVLGADFILTGSINQCTVEAGTSDLVKDMLQDMEVQDTDYAPAGDMFEIGARVQVLKRGVFFPARANKLYDVYRSVDSLDQIDEKTARMIQDKYFQRSFEAVYDECRKHYPAEVIAAADQAPKKKMALVFKWYFAHSNRLALKGEPGGKVDFQVHCGPALGGFNRLVKGMPLESWRNRHVDEIGVWLMETTATLLNTRFAQLLRQAATTPASEPEAVA
ncbi:ACP S-malonyltransferase [Burkholderia sp. S-53]|uniref:ACP S-malonyltransferase n=1 Tax=Burkholderia sp. S-53 TaxID=2906514 RepID=UPI0021D0FC03|nr:ACP S-malonyltransferase [Burkholderia sp. S-53]UXU85836.1 ACP S-malonyltransferase [Burkholderia sp. S-53]